jgi:hypothetical protein
MNPLLIFLFFYILVQSSRNDICLNQGCLLTKLHGDTLPGMPSDVFIDTDNDNDKVSEDNDFGHAVVGKKKETVHVLYSESASGSGNEED